MKFEITRSTYDGIPTTGLMTHGSESIEWTVSLFEKMKLNDIPVDFSMVFSHINQYWASLQVCDQEVIFSIYKEIRIIFNGNWTANKLPTLYVLIEVLGKYHEVESVYHWMIYHAKDVQWPEYLQESFNENRGYTAETKEKTYTKGEYKSLAALSIALRPMIPIWGEYIDRTKDEHGNVFKEFYAFTLLNRAGIMHSQAMERLRLYVEHSLPADITPSLTLKVGISQYEYPKWMLALIVIRRLVITDLRGTDSKTSIIAFIHSYMREKIKRNETSFGVVLNKPTDSSSSDRENNRSMLESTQVKQAIPQGYFIFLEKPFENPVEIAKRICPEIDLTLLKQCLDNSHVMHTERHFDSQIAIASWVLSYNDTIPARTLRYFPRKNKTTATALSICQAILWQKGHHDLAILSTAVTRAVSNNFGNDTRSRITKEQTEELDILFPFVKNASNRPGKKSNRGIESIEMIAASFNEENWYINLPKELIKELNLQGNLHYSIPTNIKPLLADLVIKIAGKSF